MSASKFAAGDLVRARKAGGGVYRVVEVKVRGVGGEGRAELLVVEYVGKNRKMKEALGGEGGTRTVLLSRKEVERVNF